MARPRRQGPRRRASLASERLYFYLRFGWDFAILDFDLCGHSKPPADLIEEAWQQCGGDVLDWHLTGQPLLVKLGSPHDDAHPGSRPCGWWQFEAPGRPELTGSAMAGYQVREAGRDWESEVSFLTRHGLLTTEEKLTHGDS
jgi:hypothetical protein